MQVKKKQLFGKFSEPRHEKHVVNNYSKDKTMLKFMKTFYENF